MVICQLCRSETDGDSILCNDCELEKYNQEDNDTTVRVTEETWRLLNAEKQQPGESFDEVIRRLLNER